MSLVRLGWNDNVKLGRKVGVSEASIRGWRDGDSEPEEENKKKLAKFWEAQMKARRVNINRRKR